MMTTCCDCLKNQKLKMKLLQKARRHPVVVALGSKVLVSTGCLCELGNKFIFHFWFFSQSQQVIIMIGLGEIFQSCSC